MTGYFPPGDDDRDYDPLGRMMVAMLKARPGKSILKRDPTLYYKGTGYYDYNGNEICAGDYVRYTDKDATTGVGINGGQGFVKMRPREGWAVENVTPYETFFSSLDGHCDRDDTDIYIRNDLK
jgi:hypothetical protein